MRHDVVFFVAAILLCFSASARGKQASDAPTSSQVENPTPANSSRDCIGNSAAVPEARQVADGDSRPPLAQADATGALGPADALPTTIHLEEDLKILEQRQSGLAQCVPAINEQLAEQDSRGACLGELLLNFEMRHDGEPERDIPIGQLAGSRAFFYESGMTIDADGAPNAYHPDNVGLDDLANAGTPGRWEGLAKDADGEPFIQGPADPFPGYYVSATALSDH